jgi:hypothetical protein
VVEQQKTQEQRTAESAALFRRANDQLSRRYAELGLEVELLPFICECADGRCTRTVVLSLEEYDDLRREPQRYVIVNGHELDAEDVVATGIRFSVVQRPAVEG